MASLIGSYSLSFGLLFSILIIFFSVKNLKDKNFFLATKILAKHDENYMPPEVKAALEEK